MSPFSDMRSQRWRKSARITFALFLALGCAGFLHAQGTGEAPNVQPPRPETPAFAAGIRLSWGIGGLVHDSDIVLPIYKSGQTYMLGLGLSFHYYINPKFFLSFDPSYSFSSHYSVLFIKPEITSHSVLLPLGAGFMLSSNTALIAGLISNYQVSATMNAAQGIGTTSSTLQLSNKDLARPGWGGYGGFQYRVSQHVTLQFTFEYYRAMINSNIAAGRVGILFIF